MVEILKIKKLMFPASLQDKGRFGFGNIGVSCSGYMDRKAASLANLMVENYGDEVLLEYAFGKIEIEIISHCYIGILGAGGMNLAREYSPGELIKVPAVGDSVWGYISVKSGFITEELLGSRSTHARARIGKSLEVGSVLSSLPQTSKDFSYVRRISPEELIYLSHQDVIRLIPSVHHQLLVNDGFTDRAWEISSSIDRSGYRLEGNFTSHELSIPSIPVHPGAIQITPSGQPIVTMNDGPTVGGYPVIGVVHPDDLAKLAQRPPKTKIKFEWCYVD